MFKAIYRGENGRLGMQNGNEYIFTCKQSLVGRGFSILTTGGIKGDYPDMKSFISDWSEIRIA
jgi:hypothetical protein